MVAAANGSMHIGMAGICTLWGPIGSAKSSLRAVAMVWVWDKKINLDRKRSENRKAIVIVEASSGGKERSSGMRR